MAKSPSTRRTGTSLVKGPVGLVGLAGIVYGVLALVFGGNSFTLRVPHGRVGDGHFLGLYTNGWTDLLFLAAGLLLVLSARAHWAARFSATLVALVLGAAAVIAAVRGHGVFGIFAANGRTELVWGAAAVVLVLLARLPRVGGGSSSAGDGSSGTGGTGAGGSGVGGESPLVGPR